MNIPKNRVCRCGKQLTVFKPMWVYRGIWYCSRKCVRKERKGV